MRLNTIIFLFIGYRNKCFIIKIKLVKELITNLLVPQIHGFRESVIILYEFIKN